MISTIFLWYLFSNKDFLDTLLWMIRYEREREREKETRKEREVLISGRRTEHYEKKKKKDDFIEIERTKRKIILS